MNFVTDFEKLFKYRIALIFLIFVLKFLLCSIGCFVLMKRRRLKFKFYSMIPFVNSSYCIGAINDSINGDYFHETYSRFSFCMIKFMRYVAEFFFVYILFFRSSDVKNAFYDFLCQNGISAVDLVQMCVKNELVLVSFFISLISVLVCDIYFFVMYSNIFNEYCGKWNKVALFCSIFGYIFFKLFFLPDLFLYLFRNKASKFEKLNKSSRLI